MEWIACQCTASGADDPAPAIERLLPDGKNALPKASRRPRARYRQWRGASVHSLAAQSRRSIVRLDKKFRQTETDAQRWTQLERRSDCRGHTLPRRDAAGRCRVSIGPTVQGLALDVPGRNECEDRYRVWSRRDHPQLSRAIRRRRMATSSSASANPLDAVPLRRRATVVHLRRRRRRNPLRSTGRETLRGRPNSLLAAVAIALAIPASAADLWIVRTIVWHVYIANSTSSMTGRILSRPPNLLG